MDSAHEHGSPANEVRHSARWLQALLAKSADMMTVSDREGRITYASPSTERVSGYSAAEFVARHPFETIHPDDRSRCEAAFAHLLATPGLSLDLQHRVLHKDGTWHWVEGTFTNLFDDPMIEGLVANVRDITARKEAEERLRDAAEYHSFILGAFGAADFDVDARTGALRCSAELKRLYGFPDDFALTLADCRERYHPDDLGQMLSVWTDAVQRGQRRWEREYRVVIPEGQAGSGVRWVLARGEALLGPDGELEVVRGAAFDITARKQADAALRASEARFRTVVDLVPDLLWSNDARGETEWYNRRWLDYTGQTLQEAHGYGWLDAIHPDDRATSQRNFQAAIDSGQSLRHEHRMRGADGTYRWFLVQALPLRDEAGAVVRWFGAATDIHEERMALIIAEEARAEAEEALQTRDQFLSIASHELRTPMTALLGYSHILGKFAARGTGDIQKPLEMVERQTQRLNMLVDQLLDVARLRRGQFAVQLQPLDLAALVQRVIDEFRVTLPNPSMHTVELTSSRAALPIMGDVQRLEAVVQNLLGNAVKYSPTGGPVRVQLSEQASEVIVEVSDTGIGIPADAQPQLFDAFYRARNVGSGTSGFGLGLYIVTEIVKLHGGRVEVLSQEGSGSTFRVALPLLASQA